MVPAFLFLYSLVDIFKSKLDFLLFWIIDNAAVVSIFNFYLECNIRAKVDISYLQTKPLQNYCGSHSIEKLIGTYTLLVSIHCKCYILHRHMN